MTQAPRTLGELRKMLAETAHDVRYGHIDAQKGVAVAKIASQIANLINAEIDAWKYLSEVGEATKKQGVGNLPIATLSNGKVIDA